jgi:hypothetical protein
MIDIIIAVCLVVAFLALIGYAHFFLLDVFAELVADKIRKDLEDD